ncbi:hypothetical protein QJQ45_014595 [Haematococcus lacustris]|nr:hypothetical protein QJQ45_014595 [Haematococcus lacustris]
MVTKKRGVMARCAGAQKAREVMAQRRAAEAEAKAQAGAAEAETQAQADAGAYEADEAGADEAGAYEADAGGSSRWLPQKHQVQQQQADLQQREQQVAQQHHQVQTGQQQPLRRGRRCLSQEQLEYVRTFCEEHSSPSPMYKDVRRYYHIANADAQDLAGVLDAGALDVRVDLDSATVQSWFVCPCKVGAKPRLACLQRQCAACKDRKVGVKAGCEGVQLQYREFKKLDNGQGVELATVHTTLGELVLGFNALMQKQLWHQYLAKHQRATFRAHCAAVRNTPGLVVVSCDWSEKLTIHQDIACQGAYWKQRTMSVFVACAHYQDMAGNYREESVFVSADRCDQSAEASTTALVQVIECLLQGRRHPDGIQGEASNTDGVSEGRDDGEGWVGKMDMRQLCLWSDGCASQFKGAKAIKLHWHLANRDSPEATPALSST